MRRAGVPAGRELCRGARRWAPKLRAEIGQIRCQIGGGADMGHLLPHLVAPARA